MSLVVWLPCCQCSQNGLQGEVVTTYAPKAQPSQVRLICPAVPDRIGTKSVAHDCYLQPRSALIAEHFCVISTVQGAGPKVVWQRHAEPRLRVQCALGFQEG